MLSVCKNLAMKCALRLLLCLFASLCLYTKQVHAQGVVTVASGGSATIAPSPPPQVMDDMITFSGSVAPPPAPAPVQVAAPPVQAQPAVPVAVPVQPVTAAATFLPTSTSCTAECGGSSPNHLTCTAEGDMVHCSNPDSSTALCSNGTRVTTCICSANTPSCNTR